MQNLPSVKRETQCTCGHPDGEHSPCTGECYLCACKHYTPAKVGDGPNGLVGRIRRLLLTWKKPVARLK